MPRTPWGAMGGATPGAVVTRPLGLPGPKGKLSPLQSARGASAEGLRKGPEA